MTSRLTAALLTTSLLIFSPSTLGSDESARRSFEEIYRHIGIDVGDETLDDLAERWASSTGSDFDETDRRAAFTSLLELMIELQDASATYPGGPPSAWIARIDEIEGLASPPDLLDWPQSGSPIGQMNTFGNGPSELVLVAGSVPAGLIADTFGEAAGDHFHVTSFDLPGVAGSWPLPLPDRRDFEKRPWLGTVADGIADEVRSRGLERPVLVGHDIGAWIALLLAESQPEMFRSVVLVEPALPPMLLARTPNGLAFADAGDRTTRVNGQLPSLIPPGDAESRYQTLTTMMPSYAQDPEIAERIARSRAHIHPTVYSRYLSELATIDRRTLMGGLETPTLLITDLDDESSVGWPMAFVEAGNWKQTLLDVPGAPVELVPFDDVRDPLFDEPLHLARTIADFTAGRKPLELPPNLEQRSNQTSKPRRVSTAIGFTEVSIDYWAPARRDREVWGNVVPWDSIWRAGANESTRLSFNEELVVGGTVVAPGTYSLLIHPRENEPWTLILNRNPWLWSTVGYDPAHNALELPVEPSKTRKPAEILLYDIIETSTGRGRLSVAWGDREISVDLRAPERLQFVDPVSQSRLDAIGNWTLLAEDPAGDAANPMIGLHDGTALHAAYECSTEMIWFRIDLTEKPNEHTIGINVAVDTDQDLTSGMNWWARNTGATFDRLLTLWVDGASDAGYAGTAGISASDAVSASRDMTSIAADGVELGVDREDRRLYLGAPARLIDDDGEMSLIATVGTHIAWNDDLIDQGQVSLSVEELRNRVCGR